VNTLTLRGYLGGQVMQTDAFSFEFAPSPVHRRLDIQLGNYDSFQLISEGPAHLGDACIDVDNVTVTPVPEPASLAIVALGLALVARRRKSSR
jgi:hypothetical protein